MKKSAASFANFIYTFFLCLAASTHVDFARAEIISQGSKEMKAEALDVDHKENLRARKLQYSSYGSKSGYGTHYGHYEKPAWVKEGGYGHGSYGGYGKYHEVCRTLSGFDMEPLITTPSPVGVSELMGYEYFQAVYGVAGGELPFLSHTDDTQINFISIQAECFVKNPDDAPPCEWSVLLSFCEDTCTQMIQGTLYASGGGPDPIPISGGTGSFLGASGSIDALFDVGSLVLGHMEMYICYYDYDWKY